MRNELNKVMGFYTTFCFLFLFSVDVPIPLSFSSSIAKANSPFTDPCSLIRRPWNRSEARLDFVMTRYILKLCSRRYHIFLASLSITRKIANLRFATQSKNTQNIKLGKKNAHENLYNLLTSHINLYSNA